MSGSGTKGGMGMQAVGLYLAELRRGLRLTQKEAADLIQANPKTVERWEAGKHEPPLTTLEAYINKLGGSIDRAMALLLDRSEALPPIELSAEDRTKFLS